MAMPATKPARMRCLNSASLAYVQVGASYADSAATAKSLAGILSRVELAAEQKAPYMDESIPGIAVSVPAATG